jgi:hypothetical protein
VALNFADACFLLAAFSLERRPVGVNRALGPLAFLLEHLGAAPGVAREVLYRLTECSARLTGAWVGGWCAREQKMDTLCTVMKAGLI